MTYAEAGVGSTDATWRARVEAALTEACVAIADDAFADGINRRRDVLARKVLLGRAGVTFLDSFARAVALGFMGSVNLTAVTDAQIAARVSAVFNDFLEPLLS